MYGSIIIRKYFIFVSLGANEVSCVQMNQNMLGADKLSCLSYKLIAACPLNAVMCFTALSELNNESFVLGAHAINFGNSL